MRLRLRCESGADGGGGGRPAGDGRGTNQQASSIRTTSIFVKIDRTCSNDVRIRIRHGMMRIQVIITIMIIIIHAIAYSMK